MDNLKTQRPQRPVNATELRRKVPSEGKKKKRPLKRVKTPTNNAFLCCRGKMGFDSVTCRRQGQN